jgi:hypothetical protein
MALLRVYGDLGVRHYGVGSLSGRQLEASEGQLALCPV